MPKRLPKRWTVERSPYTDGLDRPLFVVFDNETHTEFRDLTGGVVLYALRTHAREKARALNGVPVKTWRQQHEFTTQERL
jgi:hypothetical protein